MVGDQFGFVGLMKTRISRLIDERRHYGLGSFYLSQLGNALGSDLRKLEMHSGKRLADFLQDEFDYKIAAEDKNRTALFIYFGADPSPPSRSPRVRLELWEAFTSPLATNNRRIFDRVRDRFLDLPPAAPTPKGAIEIPSQLIIPNPGKHLVDAVSRNAHQWAREHDENILEPVSASSSREALELLSAYDILREVLTEDQLQRLTLPGDAMPALLAKRYRPAV